MRATHQITQDPDRSQRPSGERQPPRPSFKPRAISYKPKRRPSGSATGNWKLRASCALPSTVSRTQGRRPRVGPAGPRTAAPLLWCPLDTFPAGNRGSVPRRPWRM